MLQALAVMMTVEPPSGAARPLQRYTDARMRAVVPRSTHFGSIRVRQPATRCGSFLGESIRDSILIAAPQLTI
jgi:hypothetical protein